MTHFRVAHFLVRHPVLLLWRMIPVKRRAFIFDMDGTLCDVRSIRHLVAGPEKNFHEFHMQSVNCPPNDDVVLAAREAHGNGDAVLIVTARMQSYERVTSMWLALNDVPSDEIYMRQDGDFRKDYIVKREILQRIRKFYDPVHAMDDNPSVIDLWRDEGIPYTIIPGWDD